MRVKKYAVYYEYSNVENKDGDDAVYVGSDHEKVLKVGNLHVERFGGRLFEIEVEFEKGWHESNCYITLDENKKPIKAWCISEEEYLSNHDEIEWMTYYVDCDTLSL